MVYFYEKWDGIEKNPCHVVQCSFSQFSKVYCIEKRFNPSELIKKEAKKFAHKKYYIFLHSETKHWPVKFLLFISQLVYKTYVINNFNYTKCSTSSTYFSLSSTTTLYKNNYFELLNGSFI